MACLTKVMLYTLYSVQFICLSHKLTGLLWQVGVRVFHEENVDTGLSFLKLNEVGPATTETVDNEIKRLLQVSMLHANYGLVFLRVVFEVLTFLNSFLLCWFGYLGDVC